MGMYNRKSRYAPLFSESHWANLTKLNCLVYRPSHHHTTILLARSRVERSSHASSIQYVSAIYPCSRKSARFLICAIEL